MVTRGGLQRPGVQGGGGKVAVERRQPLSSVVSVTGTGHRGTRSCGAVGSRARGDGESALGERSPERRSRRRQRAQPLPVRLAGAGGHTGGVPTAIPDSERGRASTSHSDLRRPTPSELPAPQWRRVAPGDGARARDLMSAPVIAVDADTSIADAVDRMQRHGIRHLVVRGVGDPAGLLTDLDVRVGEDDTARAADRCQCQPPTTKPDAPLSVVAGLMLRHRASAVLVCHMNDVVGIVTASDFVALFADEG
jgi:CBS domain-containing protein